MDGLGCNSPAAAEKAQGKPVPDEHLNAHQLRESVRQSRGSLLGRLSSVHSVHQRLAFDASSATTRGVTSTCRRIAAFGFIRSGDAPK